MSQITSEILARIAPGTKPARLRDRFLPFLNEAMPRYGITSRLRVAAFLTTTAFESNYFRATREGKARANTKAGRAQAKYWPTGFFGRGLIQTTHEEGYQAVGEYLADKGVIDDPDLFVDHPELLEQEKWAVESACVFWANNGLNRYADSGKIFAIEGITNRGNAAKEAWGEADREAVYKKALAAIPKDFVLSSDALLDTSAAGPKAGTAQTPTEDAGGGSPTAAEPTSTEKPPTDDNGTGDQDEPAAVAIAGAATSPSLLDRLIERGKGWQSRVTDLLSFKDTVTPAGGVKVPSSLGTKLLTALHAIGGKAMVALGMLFGHWEWIVAGIVVLAIGAYLWNRSRERNSGNPPAPVAAPAAPTVAIAEVAA